MRTRVRFLAVLGLAAIALGCGDKSPAGEPVTPSTAVTTTTAAATSTTTSTAELDARLLEASDVGTGWQVGHPLIDADFADANQVPCDTPVDPTIATRLRPVTGRQFEPTDGSYKHLIEMISTGEPSRLGADLDAYIGAVAACPSEGTWNGAPVTIEQLAIPNLGDQRAAYTVRAAESAGSEVTWYIRSAGVRVGGVAMQIGLTEILAAPDGQPSITDEQFVALLQTAVGKFAG